MTHILCINPTQPHLTRRELIADLHIWARMVVNNGGLDRWLYMIDGVQVFPMVLNGEDSFVGSVYILAGKSEPVNDNHWNKFQSLLSDDDPAKATKLLKPEDFERFGPEGDIYKYNKGGLEIHYHDAHHILSAHGPVEILRMSCGYVQEACDIVNKELSK